MRFKLFVGVGLAGVLLVGGGVGYTLHTALLSGSTYRACVSRAGVVRSGTIRLGPTPTCTKSGDTVVSWNAQGPPGGLSGFQRVGGDQITLHPGDSNYYSASCPSGEVAIGGGYETSLGIVINDSWPSGGAAWNVHARNPGTFDETLRVFATCAVATP